MQVVTHLVVHDSAFLDFGRWILGFLQSLVDAHCPESVWGMLDSVSESGGTSAAPAAETITAAAPRKLAARLHLRLYRVRLVLLLLEMLLLLLFLLTQYHEVLT